MKNIVCLLLIFVVAIFGCKTIGINQVVTGVVSGYIYWKNGEAVKYYEYNPDTVYESAQLAFQKLELPVSKKESKNGAFSMVAGDKDRFKVSIDPVQTNITRVTIRVNIMGDKPYVELFYKYLDDQINVIDFPDHSK